MKTEEEIRDRLEKIKEMILDEGMTFQEGLKLKGDKRTIEWILASDMDALEQRAKELGILKDNKGEKTN